MIKCPSCGFENSDSCTFCAICGSSVTENDDYYVHNNVSSVSISVDELNKKLVLKDKQENAKTKSFKKINKDTLAKEAAKISDNSDVKIYKASKTITSKTSLDKEINNKPKTNNSEKKTVIISNKENDEPECLPVSEKDTKLYTSEKISKDKDEDKDKKNYNPNITDENNSKLYAIFRKTLFGANDETNLFENKDIEENCILAIFSYIPFLFFVPMIIKPKSGYLRYHGIQGLTMFLTFIILEFFNVIICAIISSVSDSTVSAILTIIVTLIINLFVLLLISIGIANAVKGIARELPVIGKYKLLKQ